MKRLSESWAGRTPFLGATSFCRAGVYLVLKYRCQFLPVTGTILWALVYKLSDD